MGQHRIHLKDPKGQMPPNFIVSMVLPTNPGKIYTPDFPKPPQGKKFLQKLLMKGPGYLPGGPVGEILDRWQIERPPQQKWYEK